MMRGAWIAITAALAVGVLASCGNDTTGDGTTGDATTSGTGAGTSSSSVGGGTTSSSTSTSSSTGGAGPDCGDGIVAAPGEECDDGNADATDGCGANCAVEDGFSCTGMPSVCVTECGDGVTAGAEQCDDGNTASGDGCNASCHFEGVACGNGVIDGADVCDDGNPAAGDGCSPTCTVESGFTCAGEPSVCTAICGDGMILGDEECDDGDTGAGDGCGASCAVESGFVCAGQPSVCTSICGDGIVTAVEGCDDGNTTPGDGCSATCQVEALGESEPNNTFMTADSVLPGAIPASITPMGDNDFFAVAVPGPASVLTATITAGTMDTCGSDANPTGIDSEIQILGTNGTTSLATNDDISVTTNWCSSTQATGLAAGTYYVRVAASVAFCATCTFSYTLNITVN